MSEKLCFGQSIISTEILRKKVRICMSDDYIFSFNSLSVDCVVLVFSIFGSAKKGKQKGFLRVSLKFGLNAPR